MLEMAFRTTNLDLRGAIFKYKILGPYMDIIEFLNIWIFADFEKNISICCLFWLSEAVFDLEN